MVARYPQLCALAKKESDRAAAGGSCQCGRTRLHFSKSDDGSSAELSETRRLLLRNLKAWAHRPIREMAWGERMAGRRAGERIRCDLATASATALELLVQPG